MLHTLLYRKLNGNLVGKDFLGNLYYEEKFPIFTKNPRRWVVFSNNSRDASTVPAKWHNWLHKVTNELPNDPIFQDPDSESKSTREQLDTTNKTGTINAHSALNHETIKIYDAWEPENKIKDN